MICGSYERLVEHGHRQLQWAREYLADGKQYPKTTEFGRAARKRYAALALRYWRNGQWYIWRHTR